MTSIAPPRVTATGKAIDLVTDLRNQYGPILFHKSGGCCDGSSPMCFPQGEFMVGDRDVLLGEVEGAPAYISARQFAAWRHTQLILDIVAGRGGMFSLGNGTEMRFLTRSRASSPDELQRLACG
jgi:uncharacterized protein (DUF779 family)